MWDMNQKTQCSVFQYSKYYDPKNQQEKYHALQIPTRQNVHDAYTLWSKHGAEAGTRRANVHMQGQPEDNEHIGQFLDES